mmetsp:Transcript_1307/g.3968  ORF Transcript_1307/g.3968 Transcript_1307/m.3968 type:complete len:225 (-) Transcript_1307:88-762(-)
MMSQTSGVLKDRGMHAACLVVSALTMRRVIGLRGAASLGRGPTRPRVARQPVAMMSEAGTYPFSAMDIRVGTFVDAWHHPDSEKLFVEMIDVGEGEPRQIVSGLRAYYSLEELENQRCLVVANLPKAKLAGVDSFGMVLCGSEGEKSKVEFIVPPDDAENGERVLCGDDDEPAMTPNQVKKKKIWTDVQPRLAVVDGLACFEGEPLATSAGPCRTASIQAGPIS